MCSLPGDFSSAINPAAAITPAWRTDGSGTNFVFTSYLVTQSETFEAKVGAGMGTILGLLLTHNINAVEQFLASGEDSRDVVIVTRTRVLALNRRAGRAGREGSGRSPRAQM